MSAITQPDIDVRSVLAHALIRAAKALGLSQDHVGQVIGLHRTTLTRGIEPDSKAGQLAALLIRCYRGLYALVGGQDEDMRHWMHTYNHHTGGVPAEQMIAPDGLVRVLNYLDAIRGKA